MNRHPHPHCVKRLLLAWAIFPLVLCAQDYSSTDAFNLLDRGPARPVRPSTPTPWGMLILEQVTTTSPAATFKATSLGYTFGRENRSPNVAAAFDMEIDRHELKMEIAREKTKITPSLAWTEGRGTRGTTLRENTTHTPGLTYSMVPKKWNDTGGEVSVSLQALYGMTDQTDRPASAAATTSDKRQLTLIPSLGYLTKFKFASEAGDAKHQFSFNTSYTRRGTRNRPAGKAATSSTYGFGSLNAKVKFALDSVSSLELSGTWDIPLHEKQPAGQANEGDANSTLVLGYNRKFSQRFSGSIDYRQNFDDEFNDVRRFQARVNFSL